MPKKEFKNIVCPICNKRFSTVLNYEKGNEIEIQIFKDETEAGEIGCSENCNRKILKMDLSQYPEIDEKLIKGVFE